uniref:Uncharacterized protein n=1 Tax=Medicago truncatula TaxID=3880 RepID=A2Q4V3_MEDTR|nr:hypothetical protein MtrDRAFT_AC157891g26v2 [Medicago truncatula]
MMKMISNQLRGNERNTNPLIDKTPGATKDERNIVSIH